VIASAVAARVMPETCILDVSDDTRGDKGGEKHRSSKLVPRTKVAPSTKKRIIPSIGALAALSSDGSVESSLNDPAPELLPPLKSASSHQLELWLRYLRMGAWNHR
jgi:hypothetical protein